MPSSVVCKSRKMYGIATFRTVLSMITIVRPRAKTTKAHHRVFFFAKFMNLATEKKRWWALVVLALRLTIVIIDNTVLNVAIPYILRDLNTTLDGIQWVVSGYALIIATILILMGRLGDQFGRKRIFLIGTVLFAIGSFIASIAHNGLQLFFGEAFIEAI